jgi:hypothetical protein
LDKTVRMGLESKMFDAQSLVLLAFTRLELADRKGLQRCHDDFLRLMDKAPDNPRLERLAATVEALNLIQQHQFARAVEAVRSVSATIREPLFDFESASNLVALLSQLSNKAIQLDEVETVVATLAKRFCSSRSLTELLAASASTYPAYAATIRASQAVVLEYAETAMSLSMSGNPTAGIKNLIIHGRETLNARLIDNALQLLQKHGDKVKDAAELRTSLNELKAQCGPTVQRASLGEQKRQAGGLALRTGKRAEPAPTPAEVLPSP